MATVFIFHGVSGNPGENWFPWLKENLEAEGHRVIVPAFPHSEAPKLEEWLEHFREYENDVGVSTVFVGHSLGAAFALRLLERMKHPTVATFLVAPVSGVMGNEFDPLMTTFTEAPYDWSSIRKNCHTFTVIHSPTDPYITLSKVKTLAENLGIEVTEIENAGHFNAASGYTTFPQLLTAVLLGA